MSLINEDELIQDLIKLGQEHLYLNAEEARDELEENGGVKWLFHQIEIVLENKAYCGAMPCTTPEECSKGIAEVGRVLAKFYPLLELERNNNNQPKKEQK